MSLSRRMLLRGHGVEPAGTGPRRPQAPRPGARKGTIPAEGRPIPDPKAAMSIPREIVLTGPGHPTATALRRQHEQLLEALVQTRKQLIAFGVEPGNISMAGAAHSHSPMQPPEPPEILWSGAGPHPTQVKAKARYESRKAVVANRPSRELILQSIVRALSGTAPSLPSFAVHRFVVKDINALPGELTMMSVSKYLGKNPHLFGRTSEGICRWHLLRKPPSPPLPPDTSPT